MKFYSEVTKKFYDTMKNCEEEEKAAIEAKTKEAASRKESAEKVEAAYNTYKAAAKEYHKTLNDFCSKYGTYHKSYTMSDAEDALNDWIAMINMM